MNTRTQVAVIIGVVLGAFAGHTITVAGYAALVVILFWTLINTLIVCRIANQNTILVGMIPNAVMAIVVNITLEVTHPAPLPEVLLGFLLWITFASLLSLPISVPVYLLRNYVRKLRIRKLRRAKFL